MPTISSLGVGSGLDSEGIVTKLVALEKQPLKALDTKAKVVQEKISTFGQVQSQFSTLADTSSAMAAAKSWVTRKGSTSNEAAAGITVTPTATPTSFNLDVDQLAGSQSIASAPLPAGSPVGEGELVLRLGTWSQSPASFTPAPDGKDLKVEVAAGDTVSSVAAKINVLNAGVVATAFNDGTKDRLLLRSKDTGAINGFRLQATVDPDVQPNPDEGLRRLAFDPAAGAFGMAGPGSGEIQYGTDAKARINGLPVSSKNNTLTGNIPGVTVNLLATTTTGYGTPSESRSSVTMAVSEDVTPAVQYVQNFVDAYNALSKTLADVTKYDADTKTAAIFQGDSSILGMQSVLRNMESSTSEGSTYQRLVDVGVERQLDGTLSLNTTKLAAAANNGTELQKLFVTDNKNPATNGFALKFRDFSHGVLASGGTVKNKSEALDAMLKNNKDEQTRVTDRASAFEARMRKQYTALDAKMASLNALNAYVSQQVTNWNKSKD